MNIFPTREQTSRERYTRDLQKIEDERFIQNKISEMQEFIKGKSAQNQIKALEFFITELNPEVFYNFEDFLLSYDFTVEQIKIEIKKAGGIFPFYYDIVWKKFNSDPFKEGFPLTGWIIDSFGLLFDEAAKLYKRIIFEIKDTSPAADEQPEKKPLAEKINWKAGEDILRTHLEKLRDNKFIDYKNIDAVMSGDEIAVFIKHKTGLLKATDKNIIYLFKVWYDLNFIDKSFIQTLNKEGKEQLDWQINSFIMNSFNNTNNNPFKIDSLKKAKRRDFIPTPEEIDNRMNTDLYNFIKSILP